MEGRICLTLQPVDGGGGTANGSDKRQLPSPEREVRHQETALVTVLAAKGRVNGAAVAPCGAKGLVLEVDGKVRVGHGLGRRDEGAVQLVDSCRAGLQKIKMGKN